MYRLSPMLTVLAPDGDEMVVSVSLTPVDEPGSTTRLNLEPEWYSVSDHDRRMVALVEETLDNH